jgi:hypothetical protein
MEIEVFLPQASLSFRGGARMLIYHQSHWVTSSINNFARALLLNDSGAWEFRSSIASFGSCVFFFQFVNLRIVRERQSEPVCRHIKLLDALP